MRVDEVERADGHRTTREVVEHPGAVAILAWDGAQLAMVRQWRHATKAVLLEIPAGTLEPDEPPIETARRELAEEVGLAAATWTEGPRFYTAPGFCDELMHLYLATDLVPAHEDRLGPDDDERLRLDRLPFSEAVAAAERGEIADAKSLVALLWFDRITLAEPERTTPDEVPPAVPRRPPG